MSRSMAKKRKKPIQASPPSTPPPRARRVVDAQWFWPAVVVGLAIALRLIAVLQSRQSPFFESLGLDAKYYDRWARQIAGGEAKPEAFFMSPLYSYFLAGLYRLFGRDLLLVRIVQAIIGSLSALLAYRIGLLVFDRRAAAIAGVVTAAYGALIFYDGSILITPLLVFFGLLSVFLLLRADAFEMPWLYAISGVALALAGVGKATALAFVPAALLWIVFDGRRRAGAGDPGEDGEGTDPGDRRRGGRPALRWREGLRPAALFALGVAVVIAPITLRNYAVSRDLVFVTSNGGLNFYIGNSEISTGGYVKPEGLDIVEDPDGEAIAEAAARRDLRPSEVSAYWYSRARSFIAANPRSWLALLVRKLSFTLSSYELPQLENYYFQRRYSSLLSMPLAGFAVVGPLGIVGLAAAFRRRRARLLIVFAGVYVVTIVFFFVVARYRLPVVPILAVGAGHAVVELWRRAARRRWKSLFRIVGPVLVLGFLVNANLYGVDREKGFAQPHYRLGIIYGERGDVERAIGEYRRALAIDPDYVKSYANLGALLSMSGDEDEAIRVLREGIRRDPGYGATRLNLALVYHRGGEYAMALGHIDTLVAADPENAAALTERGVLLYRMGDTAGARDVLERARTADRAGDHRAQIDFYLSRIERPSRRSVPEGAERSMARSDSLMRLGRVTEALEELERAVRRAPQSGEPLRRIALIKRDTGALEEGITLMRRALAIDPSLTHGHYTIAVFLNEAGRHEEAIREYEAELSIDPTFPPAHLNLSLTYMNHRANRNLAAFHYRRYRELGGERLEPYERTLGLDVGS